VRTASAGGLGAVVAHIQQATQDGMEAHDFEISAADDAGADFAGFAESDHGEADGGEIAELGKGVDAGFEVLNFGDGEVDVLATDADSALANVDEAISSAFTSGRRRTPRTKLKMAALAPIPSASVSTTVIASLWCAQ